MDVQSLRDFNLFALVVTILGGVFEPGGVGRQRHHQRWPDSA